MKIIIYGSTDIAFLVARELFEHNDITIIDEKEELPDSFNKLDLSFIQGSAANLQVLESAGIQDAEIFIAASASDESNIISSWSAKKAANVETACFVRKEEYISNLSSKEGDFYHSELGVDHMIWPEELLTQELFRIITVPEAIDVEDIETNKVSLFEYKVKEESLILDKPIKNCNIPDNTLIVGITRDSKLFIPDGNTHLQLNDKVICMGAQAELNSLANSFAPENKNVTNVAIIGGGSVGYMLAQDLEKVNLKIKLIEKDFPRCEFLSEKLKETLVLNCDGTDLEFLQNEDIGSNDVVVSVTNNDEKNLLCSLLAKQLGVKKVITRVSNPANVDLFEKVGIDVAVSPKEAAINEVRNKLLEPNVNILATVERGQGEVLEITMPESIKDTKLMDVKLPAKAIVATIKRGHKVIIPKGNTLIRANDTLFVFTTNEDAPKIKEYFKR